MFEYWPWWVSALSLSFITISFYVITKRSIGVSGSLARTIMWRDEQAVEKEEAPFRSNPKMFEDALMRATIEQFGKKLVNEYLRTRNSNKSQMTSSDASNNINNNVQVSRAPWTAHLVFLTMLSVGGFIATSLNGGFHVQWDFGAIHTQIFGSDTRFWLSLFVGGLLVGFGTQLGRGCTTGHGLHGCAKLVPASLIATGVFFGTGVLV
jgi:uncharacterized membrane protein YedE/YeeE